MDGVDIFCSPADGDVPSNLPFLNQSANAQRDVLPDLNIMPSRSTVILVLFYSILLHAVSHLFCSSCTGLEDDTSGFDPDIVQDNSSNSTCPVSTRKRKQYSDDTKRAVYAMLLQGPEQSCLPEGLSLQVSLAMDVSLRSVQRIWLQGQKGGRNSCCREQEGEPLWT